MMYLYCREIIYEELSFIYHRVETAPNFLFIQGTPIVNDITNLSTSVNIRSGPWTPLDKAEVAATVAPQTPTHSARNCLA
ncbi:hypothetical protein Ct61P_00579 [Colletotrichum tofieldiae]|nr:hypothetical protein Ct61P_00579 [Colletotrichum tofieldiae]